jgi:tRNA nucleotidyltransferase (CCA-adding enzyme)
VGGAVRDLLLGKPITERDWVVVGSTAEEMLAQGFRSVGKEFPVFLHPKTKEEYALARTERKVAAGYHGFVFHADPQVTLKEDLQRRDLTINAMAQDKDGTIIDPFNGQDDLHKKIFRHVSAAFSEDPVRILRLARFAARFHDFTIAPETMTLIQKMIQSGEIDALVPDRVWQELERALQEDHPERFIEVLRECGALKVIFPEIDALFGVPNPSSWHPEIDSGIHTLISLQQAVKLTKDPTVRFAVLVHDVGKATTEKKLLPKHHGHCERGAPIVKSMCQRLHAPRKYQDVAELVTRCHGQCHDIGKYSAKAILNLLESLDAFRRPDRFTKFLIACEADVKGRLGHEHTAYPEAILLKKIFTRCANLDTKKIIAKFQGENISKEIHNQRLQIIKGLL